MIQKAAISLNYIKKAPLPGSDQGLRYMFRSEMDQEDKKILAAYAWPEPLCFAKTEPSLIKRMVFALDNDGLEQAIEWLNSRPADIGSV